MTTASGCTLRRQTMGATDGAVCVLTMTVLGPARYATLHGRHGRGFKLSLHYTTNTAQGPHAERWNGGRLGALRPLYFTRGPMPAAASASN
jgi:hypothetical protein